jgi:hypothetical protein
MEKMETKQRLLRLPTELNFGLVIISALHNRSRNELVVEAANQWLHSDRHVRVIPSQLDRGQTLYRIPEDVDIGMRVEAAEVGTSINNTYFSATMHWLETNPAGFETMVPLLEERAERLSLVLARFDLAQT